MHQMTRNSISEKYQDSGANTGPLYWLLPLAIALPTLVTWIYFDWLHGKNPAVQQLAYIVGKTSQFALPLWAAWRGWGGHWERFDPRNQGLLFEVAFGLGVCALMVLGYTTLIAATDLEHTLRETASGKILSLGIKSNLLFLAVGVFYAVVHSLLEEFYWRWFIFGRGQKIWRSNVALVASILGFMAHHILLLGHFLGYQDWRTYLISCSIAVGGAFWAWLYRRTGNLSACWLSHALVDAGIFGFGYWLLFN